MTRLKITFVSLVLLAVGVAILPRYLPAPSRRREDCVKQRTSTDKMKIILQGWWGGGHPASISYSVTDQPIVGPFDVPEPIWQTVIYVRACDLIILRVVPTWGDGETGCRIVWANRVTTPGRGTYGRNPDGGPAHCERWFEPEVKHHGE